MKLSRLLDCLDDIAPLSLAESWDKVGLHVGDPAQNIRRAMLCIDLTDAVLDEAIAAGANLIVAYHPPIFSPLERLTTADPKAALLIRAVQKRIAIYSPHTALDAAPGGVTDWLAAGVGQGTGEVIAPTTPKSPGYKIVTFIPSEHAAKVRDALFAAGAGKIGDYSHCSFSHPGQGTFKGDAHTNPFLGKPGKLETADELRLELACAPNCLGRAIAALKASHPYEEPAFDILRLEPAPAPASVGAGRIWTLDQPTTASALTKRLKAHLKVKHLDVADSGQPIQCVAVCPGAGASLLLPRTDVDAYLTGEMRHHDVLAARTAGRSVFLAGHTQTERPYLSIYRATLKKRANKIEWTVSKKDTAPSSIR